MMEREGTAASTSVPASVVTDVSSDSSRVPFSANSFFTWSSSLWVSVTENACSNVYANDGRDYLSAVVCLSDTAALMGWTPFAHEKSLCARELTRNLRGTACGTILDRSFEGTLNRLGSYIKPTPLRDHFFEVLRFLTVRGRL